MHTRPVLTAAQLDRYHEHLQTDHDYRVWANVLTMEEVIVSSVDVLDGQVNYARSSEGPERTGSLVLSDPENALTFGTSYAEDDSGELWVNRLLSIHHEVTVPSIGEVATTVMVGCPTAVSHKGGEVALELADKSLLMDHGVRPRTYKKGMNVRNAIIALLRDQTGEAHFRIPLTQKVLSRPYSVGMGEDSLTPWALARRIAGQELGWRLYISADGYVTAEATNTAKTPVPVKHVLSLPDASTSFTDFSNYVKVTSTRQMTNRHGTRKTSDDTKFTMLFEGVAALPARHRLSEAGLARNGVGRLLPLVVEDNDLNSKEAVGKRATQDLARESSLDSEQSVEIVPFFHLDPFDRLNLPLGINVMDFNEVSIPLGTGGNMTLGRIKWVSAAVKVRARTRKRRRQQRRNNRNRRRGRG